jgi:branched-chain amino acid transport system substrate-binding protein
VLGKQIKVVTADTKSDPAQGANAATQVLEQGAELVLVTCDFDFGAPAAITAQAAGKISFALCAADPKFGVQGIGDLAFTMGNGTPGEGATMAEWAAKEKGWSKAFILKDTQVEYTKSVADYFKKRWLDGLGEVAGEDTFNGQTDTQVPGQISRIKEAKDAEFIIMTGGPGGPPVIRQIRAAGIDLPILLPSSLDGNYWIEAVPDLSDTYVFAFGSIYGDDPDPAVEAVMEKFRTKYGAAPVTAYNLPGYAIIEAWAKAVERAGSFDAQAVAAELEKFKDEPLVAGVTSFSDEWHINFNRPMLVIEVQGGKHKALGRTRVEKVPEVTF